VNFSFKNKEQKILSNLNLKINKNETLGFVGKSGSGKTTIVKILLGLIKPDHGELLVDDKVINQTDVKDYQTLFSYLSQENLFIPGSIKKNVAFGDNNIDEKKLYESLRITNCLEFVEKLENKIDHEIIEDGKNFSIGQLQRLALARAIYFDNQVLILDEPTSALDSDSELKFLDLINNLKSKKTIIIISHKKDTLKNCDNIYEIQDQKLVKVNIT
jgi:ABC-type bacteriocin/lantibiotic exporter with double-glycine peptidase domain